jgi:CheY-like chemotaxis protein
MSAAPSPAHDLAPPIRVLYAASSPADGEFVRTEASAHSPLISITCATGADETLTCLDAIGPFDAVLVDPQLPDGSAQALIARIRQRNPGVGIVACVTGDDESLATSALDAGAHAWIPKRKDTLSQLYPVFRRAIDRSRVPVSRDGGVMDERPADDDGLEAGDHVSPEKFDAALAMREATLAHEAERARLEDALAAERVEVTRLAVELAALRTAHDTERQDLEARVRAAQEAARAERESMRTVLGDLDQTRANLASELIAREQQYETVLGDLETAVAAHERDIIRLTDELAAARAGRPEAPASPEPFDRRRVDARAEAGRLIGAVVDDFEAMIARLHAEHTTLRGALEAGEAHADPASRLDRTLDDARALVRMLRAFSRREMQRARPTELAQTIESLRPVLARLFQEDVQLQVEVAPECGPVAIDPVQLELALVTAVLAVRAQLPTGGRVTIAARPAPAAADDASATTGATAAGVEIDITARRWRHDIAIPELASDRWLAPAGPPALTLAPIDAALKAEGGWIDTSATRADAIVIRMGLAGA